MKTSVEWLYNELSKNNTSTDSVIERINKESSIWKQAKEMEKEQIQKAFSDGQETPINHSTLPHYSRDEYYNDNYNQNK